MNAGHFSPGVQGGQLPPPLLLIFSKNHLYLSWAFRSCPPLLVQFVVLPPHFWTAEKFPEQYPVSNLVSSFYYIFLRGHPYVTLFLNGREGVTNMVTRNDFQCATRLTNSLVKKGKVCKKLEHLWKSCMDKFFKCSGTTLS